MAGLGAAYLLSRAHDVELFERDTRPGGHVNTVQHRGLGLDTGFIVHNAPNYPYLGRLFRELGIGVQDSEMSFSVACGDCGLEWSGRRPFAQPRNAVSPRFHRFLLEVTRWLRTAASTLDTAEGLSLGQYVERHGYSERFRSHFLDAADLRALVDRARPGARLPGRVRDPVLRPPRHARLRALLLAHGDGRQPPLRRRAARAAPRDGARRARRPRAPPPRRRRRADDRRRRDSPLRQGRRRDPRRPGARPPRRSVAGGAKRTRRLPLHGQRDRAAHRRSLPPPVPRRPAPRGTTR